MIAAFFRSNQPSALIALPILVVALFLPVFWHQPVAPGSLMPVAAWLDGLLGASAVTHGVLGMVLLVVCVLQLGALINDLELMDRRNHLVAFLLPVVLAGCGGAGLYDPALLGLPFVLWALRLTWRIGNAGRALQPLFDAGLLLGIAMLCYLPYALLIVVIWASVSVIRPFAWREYVLPLIAVCLVFYITWGAHVLIGAAPWQPLRTVMVNDQHPADFFGGAASKAFTSLLTVVLLFALVAFNTGYARSVIRGKNLRSAFMALALTLVVTMVLLRLLKGSFPALLAALPAAVIAGYALLQVRRAWLSEAVAIALLTIALWVQWT
jgi:hypothetical protein